MTFMGPKAALLPAIITASFLAVSTALAAPPAEPALPELQSITYRGHSYSVQMVDPKENDLRIFYTDDTGKPLHDFPAVVDYLKTNHAKLLFACNAGMFEPDLRPVGLLLENSTLIAPLNLKEGQGNFYMKPNGVFEVNEKDEAHIVESSEYTALVTPPEWATQSGPLMVQGGNINPDFNADSKNLKIRSGVGVRKDGAVVFALSTSPVNFYDFASFFLNKFKCPNALYLDGDISAFYAPSMKDLPPHTFGPIIGITEGLH
jgi:uncharacterized protein YigE (DUF2233 family)